MCGVPVHAADDYLQKLIALGFRVAVCEQVEDPAEAKQARREVGRQARRRPAGDAGHDHRGKAALAGGIQLPDGACANSRWRGAAHGACLDRYFDRRFPACRDGRLRLLADILRIEPRELIVPDTIFHDAELKPVFDVLGRVAVPQPAVLFDSASAEGRIARYFGVATLDGFGGFSRAELAAAAAAHRLCREDADRRAPAARPAGARERRLHAVHRSGDARQSRTGAHAFRRPQRLAVEGDRPHRDRRRRAAARRTADVAADRSRPRSTSGWIRSTFFLTKRRCAPTICARR